MKTIIMLTLALALTGCATAPQVQTELVVPPVEAEVGLSGLRAEVLSTVPEALVYQVLATVPAEEQIPVLSALLTLIEHKFIATWEWTAPTTGTAVEHYEVQTNHDTYRNTIYILFQGKTNIIHKVRGVDAAGRTGPWSQSSDVWPAAPEVTE